MATRRIPLVESWRYVLEEDTKLPLERQTVFTLAPLIQADRMRFRDDLEGTSVVGGNVVRKSRRYQALLDLCVEHIANIENFSAGPWPSETDARRTYLDQLQDPDVIEVGYEIWGKSILGADLGNSSAPAPTSGSGAS